MDSNKKKICIFTARFLPSVGGVENYCYNLAKTLSKSGNHCIIVTCNTHGLPPREDTEYATIFRLKSLNFLNGRYPITLATKENKSIWLQLLKSALDFVVINTRFYPLSLQALSFSKRLNIRPIVIEHGSAHLTSGSVIADNVIQLVEHGITSLDKFFPADYYAVSNESSKWLSHFRIKCKGTLFNSIHPKEFRDSASDRAFRSELGLPTDTFLVASVGRLVKEKGIIELAKSSTNLKNNISILVAGDGPLKQYLKPYESEKFHLLGPLSKDDIAALLLQADVLILPSRSEGFATVLLESAACYTPPITTDVGGAKEITCNGKYGMIIPCADPNTLEYAINEAYNSRARITELGSKIENYVAENFSWNKTSAALLEACQIAQERL